MNTNWTTPEIEYLQNKSKELNPHQLGAKLNRTAKAIYNKRTDTMDKNANSKVPERVKVAIGQRVKIKSVVHEKVMEGTVCYIHPQHRYIGVMLSTGVENFFPYALM